MNFTIVVLVFLVIFLVIEVLQKTFNIRSELSRKIAHVISGILIFFLPDYLTAGEIIALGIVFTGFLGCSKYFNILSSIHRVERKTWGEVLYPLGISLSAFLFLPQEIGVFRFGVLVLAFADAAAGIVGHRFGRYHIFSSKKTVEGAIAFFVVCAVLLLLYVPSAPISGVLVKIAMGAFLITIVEFILTRGFDNLLLPVMASLIFKFFIT